MIERMLAPSLALTLVGCGGLILVEPCSSGSHDEYGLCVADGGAATSDAAGDVVPGDSTNDASRGDSGVSDGTGGDAASFVETACLVSENTFVLAGDDFIHTGPPLIIRGGAARWGIHTYAFSNGLPSYVDVSVEVGQQSWNAEFSTKSLGQPLLPGIYADAYRASFDEGHPRLDIHGNGNACGGPLRGQLRVIEMNAVASDGGGTPVVKSFTAIFEQHCDSGEQKNVGCVHVAQ